MKAFLLSAHVLAAVICIGPITVAASIFPRYATAAAQQDASPTGPAGTAAGTAAIASATAMHRISRVYAVLAISVPVFGIATAAALGVLTELWVIISLGLTVIAGVLLGAGIVPQQRRILADVGEWGRQRLALSRRISRLRMITGLFGLTWAIVVVLMILRPGSTTGV